MKKIVIKKINDKLIPVPDKIKKEFEQVLTSGGLFKIVSKHPNYFGDTHYQILSLKPYEKNDFYAVCDKLIDKIEAFEAKYGATPTKHGAIPVTYNFGYQNDKYISAGIDINKMYIEDSVEDACKDAHEYEPRGSQWLYLFPEEPAMGNYKNDCRRFGLEFVGKNYFQGERNLVIRGSKEGLRKYADFLGYDLHPDYLYKEREFAGDIEDACEDACKDSEINDEAKYVYYADPDNEKELIAKAKQLGCKFGKIGGLLQVIGSSKVLAKVLNITEQDLIKYVDRPMSTIRKYSDSKVKDRKLYAWEKANNDIHRILRKAGYIDGKNFSAFTRPNNHLIIEAFPENREGILKVLKSTKYNVVENDDWAYGNRIGIIIPNWYEMVEDSNPYEEAEKGLEKELHDEDLKEGDKVKYIKKLPFDRKKEIISKITKIENNKALLENGEEQYLLNLYKVNDSKEDKIAKIHKVLTIYKKATKDSKVKDYDPRILEQLQKIAQEGEKLKPEYEKFISMYYNGRTSAGWRQLEKENPAKYNLLVKQKESWNNKIENLAKEWDKYINILNRGKDKYDENFKTLYHQPGSTLPTLDEYNILQKRLKNLENSKGQSPYGY